MVDVSNREGVFAFQLLERSDIRVLLVSNTSDKFQSKLLEPCNFNNLTMTIAGKWSIPGSVSRVFGRR